MIIFYIPYLLLFIILFTIILYILLKINKNGNWLKGFSKWKLVLICFVVSSIFPIYKSYRVSIPSDSELIFIFEDITKIDFPKNSKIISKRHNPGLNDSYTYFKFKVNNRKELDKLEKLIEETEFKDCPNCYSTFHKYDKYYKLSTKTHNREYNLIFIEKDKEVVFEMIKN